MTDILFIHPNASQKIYQDLSKKHSACEPPIWAIMLANHCLIKDFSAEILDCEVNGYNSQQAINTIQQLKPRVICFVVYGQQPSASTQNMEGAIDLAETIKEAQIDTKILFVGPHISALPYNTLTNDCVDMVCQNEGVYTISDLLDCLKNKGNLRDVKGLGYKEDGQIKLNTISSIVCQDRLEYDLPSGAWNLLPKDQSGNPFGLYRTAGWHSWTNNTEKSPFAAIYTSLGCPFQCNFCMINVINNGKNIFRHWKPEFIIKQFDYFAKHNVKNIKIADELFVLKPDHFLKICDLIIERKYDFNIWCYARIDTCKEEYLEKLKKAGVNWINLGVESNSTTIRQNATKGKFQDVDIQKTVDKIHRFNINVGANYIFGLPHETHQTMKETFDLACGLNTTMANFYCVMAYPGSQLYNNTPKDLLPDTYSGYSQHSYDTQPLPSENLSAKEILRFRDESWLKYHSRPEYLSMLHNKFGIYAYNNMKETVKISLKRKLFNE